MARNRAREEAASTAPDDTLADEEKKRSPQPPRASPPTRKPSPPERSSFDSLSGSGSRDPLIGRKLQEYVLEGRLGVGGMGVVYRAVQPMIQKYVAIKVLRADLVQDPRDIGRLLEEARVVSSIKHRGIINIFGAGTLEDGRHYLIMELLEGESLEQYMVREGKVPPGDAVIILEQTLSALAAAHEAGIVHRDLKPANIFLVKEASQMYVKLLDFGLARRQSQNVTRIAGTPDYISPEHARGRPAGPAADLYAFGVLCFHMLTGQLPFIGTTPLEVMEKHVHAAPPVPHEVSQDIPKAFSELILKLLEKEPGKRPDGAQVKADLRAATKQMRNAATMMSMMAVEPVQGQPSRDDDKRAKELARGAQVADLKRKVRRKWPYVVGAVVGLWLLGVLAYVLVPAAPLAKPAVKRAKDSTRVVVNAPVAPVVAAAPTEVEPKPQEPVAVEVPNDAAVEEGSVEGSEPAPPPEEDRNAVLDDVRLGALRKAADVDYHLEVVKTSMRDNVRLKTLIQGLYDETKKTCDVAQTLKGFDDCRDAVDVLWNHYNKNVAIE